MTENKTINLAETMAESVCASIRSTLIQEGLQKAREQWQTLNAMLSTEDWWPPVARAARALLDDYAVQQRLAVNQKEADAKNLFIINNNDVAGQKQWNTKVDQLGQMIGVAESGSNITHTNIDN